MTDFGIPPLKQGSWRSDDGETGGRFVVFARPDVDAYFGGAESSDPAGDLTGWAPWYSGPGRSFGHEPILRCYGRKVLVYQRTGLDI